MAPSQNSELKSPVKNVFPPRKTVYNTPEMQTHQLQSLCKNPNAACMRSILFLKYYCKNTNFEALGSGMKSDHHGLEEGSVQLLLRSVIISLSSGLVAWLSHFRAKCFLSFLGAIHMLC